MEGRRGRGVTQTLLQACGANATEFVNELSAQSPAVSVRCQPARSSRTETGTGNGLSWITHVSPVLAGCTNLSQLQ